MTDVLKPGGNILYMKVGIHAQETLEDIIARKSREIDQAGYAFWGYGGNTCHPITKVQPFVQRVLNAGPIYLCMEKMNSKHFAEPIRADLYSENGVDYQPIHPAINVLGSRFALAIKSLQQVEYELPLQRTKVAVGECTGRTGSAYIKGRVDKACLEITPEFVYPPDPEESITKISLVAELCEPYAVFLKNRF